MNNPGFGSWQSYRHTGNGLQEIGMYVYARFSIYAYCLGNPVMSIDPAGRKVMGNKLKAMKAEYNTMLRSQGGGAINDTAHRKASFDNLNQNSGIPIKII